MPQGNKGALLEILNEAGETELARKVQDSFITPSFSNRLYENNSITPDITESPVIEKPHGVLSEETLTQIAREKAPAVMPQFLPKLLQGPPTQFPPYEPTPQPIDLLQGPKTTLSGVAGTVEGMAGGIAWLTNGRVGQDLANQAREWQKSLQPTDPTFLDAVNSGFGSAATFFLPGFGIGFGAAKLAAISTKLASLLGSGVSAGLEAMTEAGTVYRNVLEETGEVDKANDAASFTFWLNLPLVAITNRLGIFSDQGGLATRALRSIVAETPQETLQEAISRVAEQKPITFGGLATTGGVGAITSVVMGGVTGLTFPQTEITPTEKIEKVTPSPLTPLDIKLPTPPPSEPKTKVTEGVQGETPKTGGVPQVQAQPVAEEIETKVELDKEAIAQIKTKEQRQRKDEIKTALKPIPKNRPARQSSLDIEERNKIITSEGYFTNKQWLIKPEFAPENLKKIFSKDIVENRPSVEDVIEPLRNIVKPAKEVAILEEITIFRADDGTIAGFKTNWINYFRKQIKDFNLKISDFNEGSLIYSGHKEAGLIMPKKLGTEAEDLIIYKQAIEEYMGITKQPPVEPAHGQPKGVFTPEDIFIRKLTKEEAKGGIAQRRGIDAIPNKEGYEKVYKPYGNTGLREDAGYYYTSIKPEQPATAEGEITEFYSGIPVKKLLEPFRWKSKPIDDTVNLPEELKFSDPEVEKAYNDAKYEMPSIFAKGLNFVIKAKESFQRKYTALDPQRDGVVSNILRVFEANPAISKAETAFILKNFTDGFGKKKMELFKRYIFLADMVQDIKKGLVGKDPDAPLRFKFKSVEQIQQEFEKYKKILNANPIVKNAIERRTKFIKELAQKQVDLDLLPKSVLENKSYYHHQVLQYMGEKAYPGLSAADVRLKRKGYQIARDSSELDYNTEYLESEFEVVSNSLAQIRTVDTLQRLKQFDITNKLKSQANKEGVKNWQSLIPDDYTFWQPEKGNIFYPALSISEKVAQEVIEGTAELTKEDLKQIHAIGKKKAQWVIPKRYAETFDDLGRFTQEGPIANISAQALASWKQWKLLNPLRAAKYILNNLSGDLDIVIAYDYHILKYVPESFREIKAFSQAIGMSEEVNEFFQEGGLESGITVHEIPDISKLGYFKLIAGEKPNLINRYWDTVKGFNNFRENLLRLAAYKHFKRNLLEGKVLYGASRKVEIDDMVETRQPLTSIAAKLARELIGDYGNVSFSGNWIRRHMMPFYSWLEINLPRYVRIAENLSAENRGGGKSRAAGAFVVGRAVKFAFFAGLLYSAIELWNRTTWKVIPGFPSPDELTDWQRKQHHIILGRRDDGSLRTLRFQGALGDALGLFGLEDLVQDVQEINEGGWETLKDKGKEVVLAPIERIVQGSRPLIKTAGEALLGNTLYPDITNPRPVRDPWEHALRLIDANKPYRYIKGLPMRGLRDDIESFIFYISDPSESHYYNVRNYVWDYLDKKGIETPAMEPTKKSNALYYYKQALRYGEKEKAQEFWEEYRRLGGTVEGKEQSIRMAHPLYGVKNVPEFKASLTVEKRKEIDEAEKWYRKVYFERTAPKKEQEQKQSLPPFLP